MDAEKVIQWWDQAKMARGDLKFYLLRAFTLERAEAVSKIVKPDVLALLDEAVDDAPTTEEVWARVRRFAMGGYTGPGTEEEITARREAEKKEIAEYRSGVELFRATRHCLFPTVRPAFSPSWLTSTAVALAHGIYADKAFDRLPILADALQDAGCEDADILTHCRGSGPHVRGCWVVDLVLGKN